ncbi:MAG: NifU N-terminal domain-containing protein [Acidimicrobiia bacterium]
MVSVRATRTPNPNAMKFTLDVALPRGLESKQGDEPEDPFEAALLGIDGVESVFGVNDFVTIIRQDDAEWNDIVCAVEDVVCDHLDEAEAGEADDSVAAAQKLLRDAASGPSATPVEIGREPNRDDDRA